MAQNGPKSENKLYAFSNKTKTNQKSVALALALALKIMLSKMA